MRSALEFETTAQPASAKRGSSSPAMAASSAAKITLGAPSGPRARRAFWRRERGVSSSIASAASPYLSFRTIGSGQPRHLEPGMVLEHLDEALTHDAGSAKILQAFFPIAVPI